MSVTQESQGRPASAQVHGWIMGVAFAFVLPLGAVLAYCFKNSRGSLWFQAHRALQVTGV